MEIIKINDNLFLAKNVQDKKSHEIYEEAWAKTQEELEAKFQDVEPQESVDFLNPVQENAPVDQEQPEENTETINIL